MTIPSSQRISPNVPLASLSAWSATTAAGLFYNLATEDNLSPTKAIVGVCLALFSLSLSAWGGSHVIHNCRITTERVHPFTVPFTVAVPNPLRPAPSAPPEDLTNASNKV
ncbi:MAG: hypothetical protein KBC64_02820 [Simkaniaceae bacterium]|nr:hypothetical protein [Simkaniaceae bacterium]